MEFGGNNIQSDQVTKNDTIWRNGYMYRKGVYQARLLGVGQMRGKLIWD